MQGILMNICRHGSASGNLCLKRLQIAEACIRPDGTRCFKSGAPLLRKHGFQGTVAADFLKPRDKSSSGSLSPSTAKDMVSNSVNYATIPSISIEACTESRGGRNIIPLSSLILSKQQLFQGFPVRPAALHKSSMAPSLHFGGHYFSAFFRAISTTLTAEDSQVEGGSSRVIDPTHEVAPRIKFKRLSKTAKHIMQILDVESVQEVKAQREIPNIKPGHIVQLKVEVPENKRRVSVLKGIVIARRNAGLNTTFRIRRLVAGVGVESVFPLYSPNIKEIKVLDQKKVRRAKLYYLRDRMASANRK